jgi:hypothetical protein
MAEPQRGTMKIHSLILILILCAIPVTLPAQTTPPKSPTLLEQTLLASEKSFIEAAKKQDLAFFKRTLTDDFSFVGVDGELSDRQQMIDERQEDWLDIQPYNMKVVTISDDVGIVTYDVVLRVPPSQDEGPPPRYQHFSTVWVRQGDAWKMKFQQTTAAHYGDW